MSDKTEREDIDEALSLEMDDALLEEDRQQVTQDQPRRSGVAGLLAVLALLLAAGALAGGYFVYEQEIKPLKRLKTTVKLISNTGATQDDLQAIQQNLQALSAGNERLESEIANAGGEYQSLQAGMADLRREAQWGQREWSLAEVEFLVNVARQQLQINQDVGSAVAALEGAAKRLDTVASPELAPLRQQLSQDIAMLENLPPITADEILHGLMQASKSIQPIPEPAPETSEPAAEEQQPTAEKGLNDIWSNFKSAVSSRVRVVRHEAPLNALTQQGVEAWKVDMLMLKIEVLRLTLMQRDNAALQRELTRLSTWVKQTLPEKQAAGIEAEIQKLQAFSIPPMPVLQSSATAYLQPAGPTLELVEEVEIVVTPQDDAVETDDAAGIPVPEPEATTPPDAGDAEDQAAPIPDAILTPAEPEGVEQPMMDIQRSSEAAADTATATEEQPATAPGSEEIEALDNLLNQLESADWPGAAQ